MSLTVCEVSALRHLLKELDKQQDNATPIYMDNQPSIDVLKRPAAEGRTKHVDIRYHVICEKVEDGTIKVIKTHTMEQAADGLTKALDRPKFEQFKLMASIVDCSKQLTKSLAKSKLA